MLPTMPGFDRYGAPLDRPDYAPYYPGHANARRIYISGRITLPPLASRPSPDTVQAFPEF